jgi:hypothetical protein
MLDVQGSGESLRQTLLPAELTTTTNHTTPSSAFSHKMAATRDAVIDKQCTPTVAQLATRFQSSAVPASSAAGAGSTTKSSYARQRKARTYGGNPAFMTAEEFRLRKKRQEEEYRRARECSATRSALPEFLVAGRPLWAGTQPAHASLMRTLISQNTTRNMHCIKWGVEFPLRGCTSFCR